MIAKEVDKLLEVGFIREVTCSEWLGNGKSQMYVDFNDINKACPKDNFLLLRIDILVNYMLLTFLNTFLVNNQIQMYLVDQEKTTAILLSCHMPFGLKNPGATY